MLPDSTGSVAAVRVMHRIAMAEGALLAERFG